MRMCERCGRPEEKHVPTNGEPCESCRHRCTPAGKWPCRSCIWAPTFPLPSGRALIDHAIPEPQCAGCGEFFRARPGDLLCEGCREEADDIRRMDDPAGGDDGFDSNLED